MTASSGVPLPGIPTRGPLAFENTCQPFSSCLRQDGAVLERRFLSPHDLVNVLLLFHISGMEDRTEFWRTGIRWLSFYRDHSVVVRCPGCALRKVLRVNSILDRIGDVSIHSAHVAVARALKCNRVDLGGYNRCRLAIPLSAYEPLDKLPSRMEFLRFPPDAHRLADTELGNVPEWYVLSGFCKCGYFRNVDINDLRKAHPPATRTDDLARCLRCKRCGNTKGNFFIYQKMLR